MTKEEVIALTNEKKRKAVPDALGRMLAENIRDFTRLPLLREAD